MGERKAFLTVPEAGRHFGVGRARAYQMVRRGEIPAIRLGRRWYVPRRALERLADDALEQAAQLAREGGLDYQA